MKTTFKGTKILSWLPIFPGFYNTIFEADESDEIYQYNQENKTEKTYEDFDWKYDDYNRDVCENSCDAIGKQLVKLGYNITVKYDNLDSPKYYNYVNDTINCTYYFKGGVIEKIQTYINENLEAWNTYIKNRYTSYDGWISPCSNNGEDWLPITLTGMKADTNIAGVVIGFILTEDGYTESDLYNDVEAYLNYEVKEFEFYELNKEATELAIRIYREVKGISLYVSEIDVVALIEAEEPDLKFDYSGNFLNLPGAITEIKDPHQLNLF